MEHIRCVVVILSYVYVIAPKWLLLRCWIANQLPCDWNPVNIYPI